MYEILPALKGADLNMDTIICVGFGGAGYSKDGKVLWQEGEKPDVTDCRTVGEIEMLAEHDPDHDWRIFFYAPLYDAEYQRQGKEKWVLVRKGPGFA